MLTLAHLAFASQNKLGGGEGIEGLYGTLARSGMQRVLDCMQQHCDLEPSSRLVDVGAGIGRRAAACTPQLALHVVSDGSSCDNAWTGPCLCACIRTQFPLLQASMHVDMQRMLNLCACVHA